VYLSPKQVAEALEVSESSVKRWCDSGRLTARYTSGGHRRVRADDLLKFVHSSDKKLVHPEILGLPALNERSKFDLDAIRADLCEALLHFDETKCREIVSELYVRGLTVLQILESVIRETMVQIGDRWSCGDADVYQERRGCELVTMLIHDLRRQIPEPPEDARVAIGGTTSGDHYRLASLMVETVLKEIGWNATSLGENLPMETFAAALERHQPDLVWFSLSHLTDKDRFIREYNEFYKQYGQQVAIVIGGRDVSAELLSQVSCFAYCETLKELVDLTRTNTHLAKR